MLEIYAVVYGSRYNGLFPQEPLYTDKQEAVKEAKKLLKEKKQELRQIWTKEELEGRMYDITYWYEVEDEDNYWTNDVDEIKVKPIMVK